MQPLRLKSMTFVSPDGLVRMTDTLRVSKFALHDRLPRGRREANALRVGSPWMNFRPGDRLPAAVYTQIRVLDAFRQMRLLWQRLEPRTAGGCSIAGAWRWRGGALHRCRCGGVGVATGGEQREGSGGRCDQHAASRSASTRSEHPPGGVADPARAGN